MRIRLSVSGGQRQFGFGGTHAEDLVMVVVAVVVGGGLKAGETTKAGVVTSETVVEMNSDLSNVHPSEHSSVFSWLALMELFSANSCHWGSTYLNELDRK